MSITWPLPGFNKPQAIFCQTDNKLLVKNTTQIILGDEANKFLIYEQKLLEQLGVPVTTHGKFPDVILYDAGKDWLYLVEVVTSHGPISHKRKPELEQLLQYCKSGLIFVTAFLDGKELRRHATEIAWETEVSIAEMPEHMLHYNGDRFMGPRDRGAS
jgi:BsuBI/PstI restriction endonuclease domain